MHVRADGAVTADFVRVMLQVAAAYPTTGKLSEPTIRTYAVGLGGYTAQQVMAAWGKAFRDGALNSFFPSLPDMLRLLEPSADDAALVAWATFRRAAEDVGAYASLEVEDAAAAEALELVFGGWPGYCGIEEGPALGARRQEFLAAYRDARRRRAPGTQPCRLAGLCEATGRYRGGPGVVVGRLTAAGHVQTLPDTAHRPALEAHAS